MKLTCKPKIMTNEGKWYLVTEIPFNLMDKLKKLINKEGFKTVEIKQPKRSNNANAYCWTLCDKIAKVLNTTAEEVYLSKLRDYGTCEYVGCLPDIIPEMKKAIKIVEVKGKCMVNGVQGVTLKLIRGSSTYDVKEMSTLIEGLVNDAKTLQIEILSPQELERMMKEYEQRI